MDGENSPRVSYHEALNSKAAALNPNHVWVYKQP